MTKRYYPEKINIITSADESAMITGIDRIPGEPLFEYKKRVLENSARISNSSYEGLINGVNRELGLKQQEVIRISLKNILTGDLADPLTMNSEFIISDNRIYRGVIDGTNTRILADKLRSNVHLWEDNYLVGLTLEIDGNDYQVISNTYNELTLDREPESLFVGATYTIRAKWEPNIYIGYSLILENERYIILSNTDSTLTVNKPISFRENGYFYLALTRPRIEVTSSRIIFYIEYLNDKNYRIDLVVDLRENNLTHRDLCKLVNKESKFFSLEDLIPYENAIKAFTFKQKDSDIKVFQEAIPTSKFFKLQNKNIKPGTLKFSESNIFSKEEEELTEELTGPYYLVNYHEGIIKTTMLPSGVGEASYVYMDFPFTVEMTPAVVLSLADKESEQFLFSQKEKIIYDDSRHRFVSSQPKAEMIEYISELLRISKQSWGI